MIGEGLRLAVYFGERDRHRGRLLADALIDVFAAHELATSMLVRGFEGFGLKHRLVTDRLLSLSQDLPLLALAVDERERVERALPDVREICGEGVITLERARLLDGALDEVELARGGEVKLTVCTGRQARVGGRPAHLVAVDCLRRHGAAGATVLLGLDGTAAGVRRRGRFFARNAHVPSMIQSVGEGAAIMSALEELSSTLPSAAMTAERVLVCKRDGHLLARPPSTPTVDADGRAYWQKLVVYSGEQARHDGVPLHGALIRRLRGEGAAGATALRGIWGYHGDHAPHGERLWSLARRVPVLTVVLDTPANVARWFAIVDELTGETGLVTIELVPALRASAPRTVHGGLELARPHDGTLS
jgi:PII-like signaling protein